MKTTNIFASILLLFSCLFIFSCTPADLDYKTTTKEFISGSTWTVDYYYAGQDKTVLYSNYQFSFIGDGTVEGTGGINSFTGTWGMLRDVNRNDVLLINIISQEPQLSVLNEQWSVTDKSSTIIVMKDDTNCQLRLRKL